MRATVFAILALALVGGDVFGQAAGAVPIKLHPDNPHYFLFRGKPTILITSGEHYGAVLNLDFDYIPYLDELAAKGLNATRTFSGSYREVPGSFGITDNTLAPKRFICPWARSTTPGASDGGNKFDLNRFDPAYLARLRDFVGQAGKRGIVVELVLFCTLYDDGLWKANPMNAANNINQIGAVPRSEVFTLKHANLQAVQDNMVKKILAELKDLDNIYYEICNEPYFEVVTPQWSDHIAGLIAQTESTFPAPHLIAQNIANGSKKIDKPNPNVSIFNFHYATPPNTVEINYGLNKVIGDDETGFRGKDDIFYRTEAWDFILAGGGEYSNLDYSFTPGHPGGTLTDFKSPGGGGAALRSQLRILKTFIEGFDFIHMAPANELVKGGSVTTSLSGKPATGKATVRVLAQPGKAYAVYVLGGTQATLQIDLPAGTYQAQWINTRSGKVDKEETIKHAGGTAKVVSPEYNEDIALKVVRDN